LEEGRGENEIIVDLKAVQDQDAELVLRLREDVSKVSTSNVESALEQLEENLLAESGRPNAEDGQ
jgi:hypothetical protein